MKHQVINTQLYIQSVWGLRMGSDKTRNEGNGNGETEMRKWKWGNGNGETEMRKWKWRNGNGEAETSYTN